MSHSVRSDAIKQRITPFLWFDHQAEEAVNFYMSVFDNGKILNVSRYDEAGATVSGQPVGSAMAVVFEIEGQQFTALNGGPVFKFNESVSFVVNCKSQDEVDYYWHKLSADPKVEQCGWLKDKYGLSWQIVPTALGELLQGKDPEKSKRVMQAMLQMKKIEINTLKGII
jgi:predicted 3-demethylubiquinone-9 3-methyltransferase (glyoxalase superfamily)